MADHLNKALDIGRKSRSSRLRASEIHRKPSSPRRNLHQYISRKADYPQLSDSV